MQCSGIIAVISAKKFQIRIRASCMDMTDPYFMSLDKYNGNYMKIFCKRPTTTDENLQHMPPHEPNPLGTYVGIEYIAFSSIFHVLNHMPLNVLSGKSFAWRKICSCWIEWMVFQHHSWYMCRAAKCMENSWKVARITLSKKSKNLIKWISNCNEKRHV